MVIMQKIGGYVNATLINLYACERTMKLLQMHYNDILSILQKIDLFVHKHALKLDNLNPWLFVTSLLIPT